MPNHPRPAVIAFDAYGTLFDVYSVGAKAESLYPGAGAALTRIWREKQVDYSRLRSMAGPAHYQSFWQITEDALRHAAAALALSLGPDQVRTLMGAYAELRPFPENRAVLERLASLGIQLCILSNGSPEMLESAVGAAGFSPMLNAVLSAHTVQCFKVDPRVYQLVVDRFGVTADQVVFVSSNGWDVCGASWFGFKSFWVNRSDAPQEELGASLAGEGRDLHDLLVWLGLAPGSTSA